jgi:hypothetical protein
MMSDGSESWDDLLLDLHLRRLDAERAAEVEQEVASSPELAAKSRGLRELLHLLDADEVVTPAGLADRVIARIEAHDRVIPMPEPALATGQQDGGGGFSYAWRDLLAAAACIVLFFSLAVPGWQKVQNVSYRSQCLGNLQGISKASTSYALANGGCLPYANYVKDGSWLPPADPKVPFDSNSRHMFNLATQRYVRDVRIFICQADKNGRPVISANLKGLQDFPQRCNNSYSFIFMNTPQGPRIEQLPAGMVLMADRNPLLPNTPGPVHMLVQPDAKNSPLHEHGAGQNAVYADGHGGWFTSPTIGVDRDDIYRIGQINFYNGTETPVAATDSFLTP